MVILITTRPFLFVRLIHFFVEERNKFKIKKISLKHPTLKKLFPINPVISNDLHPVRDHEQLYVNNARTMAYYNSAIPAIQRRLNKHFS